MKKNVDDKYINSSVESQYDNYLSSEEEVDEKEEKESIEEDLDLDKCISKANTFVFVLF